MLLSLSCVFVQNKDIEALAKIKGVNYQFVDKYIDFVVLKTIKRSINVQSGSAKTSILQNLNNLFVENTL